MMSEDSAGDDQSNRGMSVYMVARLARFNKVSYQYDLINEKGPAHAKVFTVCLRVGGERYTGEGPSMKKAQREAAAKAVDGTELQKPNGWDAQKNRRHSPPRRSAVPALSETWAVLTAVARRLGLTISFRSMPVSPGLTFVCGTGYTQSVAPIVEYVFVGDMEFAATGSTQEEARFKAAQQALTALHYHYGDDYCAQTSSGSLVLDQLQYKSGASLLNELSTHMSLSVCYEELSATGPSHRRTYAMSCQVTRPSEPSGNLPTSTVHIATVPLPMSPYLLSPVVNQPNNVLVTEGQGPSKKAAREDATRKMIYRMEYEWGPLVCPGVAKVVFGAMGHRKRREHIGKDRKMARDYGEMINPVSRLMQLQQMRNGAEPVFRVTQATDRSAVAPQFVVSVTLGDLCTEGKAPNKRLAKRYAAELMLERLGFSQPLPDPPAKPAIKNVSALSPCTDEGFDEAIVSEESQKTSESGAGRRIRFDAASLCAGEEGSGKGFRKQKCSREGILNSRNAKQLEMITEQLHLSCHFTDVQPDLEGEKPTEAFTTLTVGDEYEIFESGATVQEAREKAARTALRHLQLRSKFSDGTG